MLLDANGYCIQVDFGLSKVIDGPDYMAPELIRGTGNNGAVDYWALGILHVRILQNTVLQNFNCKACRRMQLERKRMSFFLLHRGVSHRTKACT
jgi:serine/threonine protein kinase